MNTQTSTSSASTFAKVLGVNGNIVRVEISTGQIRKNEVAYVCVGDERLEAEVLRIYGKVADMQVFEETHGVRFGDTVELTGNMLSVELGPGMLGVIYDGLQNPLTDLAEHDGFFLKRGRDIYPLHKDHVWDFTPLKKVGDWIHAGEPIGFVPEKNIQHKIMAPFDLPGRMRIDSIATGAKSLDDVIATIRDDAGRTRQVTMVQSWPVRRPVASFMQRQRLVERMFPSEPLITTTRTIDTFFPVAPGGTACVPGRTPFGPATPARWSPCLPRTAGGVARIGQRPRAGRGSPRSRGLGGVWTSGHSWICRDRGRGRPQFPQKDQG